MAGIANAEKALKKMFSSPIVKNAKGFEKLVGEEGRKASIGIIKDTFKEAGRKKELTRKDINKIFRAVGYNSEKDYSSFAWDLKEYLEDNAIVNRDLANRNIGSLFSDDTKLYSTSKRIASMRIDPKGESAKLLKKIEERKSNGNIQESLKESYEKGTKRLENKRAAIEDKINKETLRLRKKGYFSNVDDIMARESYNKKMIEKINDPNADFESIAQTLKDDENLRKAGKNEKNKKLIEERKTRDRISASIDDSGYYAINDDGSTLYNESKYEKPIVNEPASYDNVSNTLSNGHTINNDGSMSYNESKYEKPIVNKPISYDKYDNMTDTLSDRSTINNDGSISYDKSNILSEEDFEFYRAINPAQVRKDKIKLEQARKEEKIKLEQNRKERLARQKQGGNGGQTSFFDTPKDTPEIMYERDPNGQLNMFYEIDENTHPINNDWEKIRREEEERRREQLKEASKEKSFANMRAEGEKIKLEQNRKERLARDPQMSFFDTPEIMYDSDPNGQLNMFYEIDENTYTINNDWEKIKKEDKKGKRKRRKKDDIDEIIKNANKNKFNSKEDYAAHLRAKDFENFRKNGGTNEEQMKRMGLKEGMSEAEQKTAFKKYMAGASKDDLGIADNLAYYKIPQIATGVGATFWLVNQMSDNKGQQSNSQLYSQSPY